MIPVFKYDFFISHASEDKTEIVEALFMELQRNHSVWYDKYSLTVGDSLSKEIDKGLRECRFGIVVLSPSFFDKGWPEKELSGLFSRELADGRKVILPVWHQVDFQTVSRYSPTLADRFAVSTKKGVTECAEQILRAFKKDLYFATKSGRHTHLGVPFFATPDGRKVFPGDFIYHPQSGSGSVTGVSDNMMTVRVDNHKIAGATRITFMKDSEGLDKLQILESHWR